MSNEELVAVIQAAIKDSRELNSDYLLFATFLVTSEDAKAYLYSLSNKRRVHKWKDIRVNLYI